MDSNEDNFDFGYIQIIQREKHLYQNYDLWSKSPSNNINEELIRNNIKSSIHSNDYIFNGRQDMNQLIYNNNNDHYEESTDGQVDGNIGQNELLENSIVRRNLLNEELYV